MNEVVKAIDVGIIALICLALLGPVDDGDDVRRCAVLCLLVRVVHHRRR